MNRFGSKIALAGFLAGVLSLPASAQQGPGPHARLGGAGRHALRCLRNLDLSDSQRTAIRSIFQNSRPTLKAAHDAVKADFQKLEADADAGAAPAVLGQDFLAVRADRQKIQAALAGIKTQVAALLTDDQKTRFQACADALTGGKASGSRRNPASF